jgi:hypothetical protein
MKKKIDAKYLEKEAAHWESLKKAAADNPGKVCHK